MANHDSSSQLSRREMIYRTAAVGIALGTGSAATGLIRLWHPGTIVMSRKAGFWLRRGENVEF